MGLFKKSGNLILLPLLIFIGASLYTYQKITKRG
jgi:CHASE3 domain sensor protein